MTILGDYQEVPIHPHTNAKDWRIYARGPIFASVCTRMSFHDAEIRINKEIPQDVGYWQYASDQPFAQGIENGCPCPGRPKTHRHLLFKLL